MLEIVAAQELEEDLSNVDASVGDLISAKEIFSMAGPTFEFGESLMTAEDIAEMVEAAFFNEGRVKFLLLVRLFAILNQATLLCSVTTHVRPSPSPVWVSLPGHGDVPAFAASLHPQWDSNSQEVLLGM